MDVVEGGGCLPEEAVFPLGGERRPFSIRRSQKPTHFDNAYAEVTEHLARSCEGTVCRFRLYLLTPTWFEDPGWRPPLEDRRDGIEIKLRAAAVPRSVSVSGWNIAQKEPRVGTRYVPAGSVYFFEATAPAGTRPQNIAESLMNRFWLKSISPKDEDQKMGFGITLIGGFSYGQ